MRQTTEGERYAMAETAWSSGKNPLPLTRVETGTVIHRRSVEERFTEENVQKNLAAFLRMNPNLPIQQNSHSDVLTGESTIAISQDLFVAHQTEVAAGK